MANHDSGHDQRKMVPVASIMKQIFPTIWIGGRDMGAIESAIANRIEFINWLKALANEAQACYINDIKNAPPTVNKRIYKQSMLAHANATFFKRAGAVFVLPGLPGGKWNVNGDGLDANLYGRNGFHEHVNLAVPGGEEEFLRKSVDGTLVGNTDEAVMVWDNMERFPFWNYVMEYAQKIADMCRTHDTTADDLKNPRVFTASTPQEVAAVQEYIRRRNNHEEYIDLASAGVFTSNVNVIEFKTNAEDLRVCTSDIEWQLQMFRALELIDGTQSIDKMAEITKDELNKNKAVIEAKFEDHKNYIKEQFEFVNFVLGTNMEPVFFKDKVDEEEKEEQKDEEHENTGTDSGRES